MPPKPALCTLLIAAAAHPLFAQSISTNTPIPPLQWINLTNLLQGSSPPPLKDASIGYDPTSRNLLIFGGESQGGFPQSQTYLLNLNSLTWSKPSPPDGLTVTPPPRSAAIGGSDFAASYRRGHVVIGGKDAHGNPLSDVWEFDYNNEFWTQVGIPPGGPTRWSAVGGIDATVGFDPTGTPTPNNTFYLAGGVDTNGPAPLSDTWQMRISGTLSSNLANDVNASWIHQPIGSSPAQAGDGGTVIGQQVIAVGGCANTTSVTASCAQQGSWVFNFDRSSSISPGPCAAPRIGASVVANMNGASQNFKTQVFVMLGIFNTSLWQDGGNLQKGEVDVLDIQGGSWARVLPAGDPGQDGKQTFPSPREGAAAVTSSSPLVGPAGGYSDTIVFGGRDASGNYFNELWVLRSYNASVSSSGQKWSGFGNGQLQTGVGANGAGVAPQYLTSCVSAISQSGGASKTSSGGTSPTSGSNPTNPASSGSPSQFTTRYDTSFPHKLLAPLSIVLLLPTVVLYRASLPSTSTRPPDYSLTLRSISAIGLLASYGLGIGGIATSFTSVSSVNSSNLAKRAPSANLMLKTAHGQAGLALFIVLYGLVPGLFLIYMIQQRMVGPTEHDGKSSPGRSRMNSSDTAEKLNSIARTATGNGQNSNGRSPAASPGPGSAPSTHRRRFHSWGGPGFFPGLRGHDGRTSSESALESEASSGPARAFEVVNRPQRTRHLSASGTITLSDSSHRMVPRDLNGMSWLERRRSVNAVGELDYALSQMPTRTVPPTPGTVEALSTRALMRDPSNPSRPLAVMPPFAEVLLHALFHAAVIAICILSLIALWNRAPKATFAVFLVWTVACYAAMVLLAWHGRPQKSALTVLLGRLRGDHQFTAVPTATPSPSRPMSTTGTDQFPFPTEARSPYIHQPPYRAANEEDHYSTSHAGPISVEADDPESDEDEETRQRRIEEEMGRREVSIVTVPKRKLWITNPS
ncbi:hypothetical protein DENSPDRAFT_791200 [Dentipellis sp. KUC8613]|nr:hypothetical protein DENSPDRAFT_791200 [Dentipellis sp. KUC8613]